MHSFSPNPSIVDTNVIDHEEIIATNEITIETTSTAISTLNTSLASSPSKTASNSSSASTSSNRTSGGICSVLLEVIEKLRHEESDISLKTKKKSKSKKHVDTIPNKNPIDQKSKRGRKRKVNELISESLKEEEPSKVESSITLKEKQAANKIVNILSNESTTVTKSLNNNNNKKQQLNYLCIKCKKQFLNKINLVMHKISECVETTILVNDTINNNNNETTTNDYEIIYACDSCDFKCLIKENLIDHLIKNHNEKSTDTSTNTPSSINLEVRGDGIKNPFETFKPLRIHNSIKRRYLTTASTTTTTTTSTLPQATLINSTNSTNNKFISLLISLATNDGYEQYVCGLCPYVCYHLPSLKSHMWTHVTNRKFDYSLNTTIINAALDYENKLNRQLLAYNGTNDGSNTPFNDLANPYELINYPLSNKITNTATSASTGVTSSIISSCDKPMVSFRCSKCGYSTINLSLLRLHKRQHYIKIISPNTSKIQLNKITEKETTTQKFVINS